MKRVAEGVSEEVAKKAYHQRNLVARLLPDSDGPDQIALLRVVIQDRSNKIAEGDLKPCGHAELAASIFVKARPAVLQAAQRRARCDLCEASGDIWLCLTCLGMFCSREDEGHHGIKHYAETGHCVVLSLVSLNFWCYAHEQYLEHDFYPALMPIFRAVHEVKHGEPALIADGPYLTPEPIENGQAFPCSHVDLSVSKNNPPLKFSIDNPCLVCSNTDERWVCLSCFQVYCGRYANKHMAQHNRDNENHDICLNLKDLSIWCQKCQQYLDTFKHPQLAKFFNLFHKLKFKDEPLPLPLTYQASLGSSDLELFDLNFDGSQ